MFLINKLECIKVSVATLFLMFVNKDRTYQTEKARLLTLPSGKNVLQYETI